MSRFVKGSAAVVMLALLAGMGPEGRGWDAAKGVTSSYLDLVIQGRPYKAVDDCFDGEGFARRVFKADFDKLSADDAAYVSQLSSVLIKVLLTNAGSEASMKVLRDAPTLVTGENDEARVTMRVVGPSRDGKGMEREFAITLQRRGDEWKIVDVDPIAQEMAKVYAGMGLKTEGRGHDAAFFMEGMVASFVDRKLGLNTDAAKSGSGDALRDAQAGNLRAQLKSLQNQIELYMARENHYPDLSKGWDVMIKGGYFKKAPVNPMNSQSSICAGKTGKAGFGWTYDQRTGTVGACYYNEETDELTPGKP